MEATHRSLKRMRSVSISSIAIFCLTCSLTSSKLRNGGDAAPPSQLEQVAEGAKARDWTYCSVLRRDMLDSSCFLHIETSSISFPTRG